MPGAVLFDLDGTLVDSRRDLAAGVNLLLADLGLPPLSVQTVMQFVGSGARDLIRRTLDHVDPGGRVARDDPHMEHFLLHYWSVILDTTVPFPGVREGLATLGQAGVAMAVVSNKPHEATLHILRELGLLASFGVVLGGEAQPRKKPDPDGLLLAASRLGFPATGCLMVGDSDLDALAARAAGMPCAWCSWGGIQEQAPPGVDLAVDGFAELVDLVLARLERV